MDAAIVLIYDHDTIQFLKMGRKRRKVRKRGKKGGGGRGKRKNRENRDGKEETETVWIKEGSQGEEKILFFDKNVTRVKFEEAKTKI